MERARYQGLDIQPLRRQEPAPAPYQQLGMKRNGRRMVVTIDGAFGLPVFPGNWAEVKKISLPTRGMVDQLIRHLEESQSAARPHVVISSGYMDLVPHKSRGLDVRTLTATVITPLRDLLSYVTKRRGQLCFTQPTSG